MSADPSFRMKVEHIEPVYRRGMVAIGTIESGTVKISDTLQIQRTGSNRTAVVIAISAFRKELQQAQKGDSVGILLRGLEFADIQPGDLLAGLQVEAHLTNQAERKKGGTVYRNEKYGFEIELPEGWKISSGFSRIPVIFSNTFLRANILEEFSYGGKEFLNIVIEPMRPEVPPDINEMLFAVRAQEMNYTGLHFGRITVGDRAHAWVSYVMNRRGWLKKYLIVLNGYGYALTASCPMEYRNLALEKRWDGIATSLRLLNPVDHSVSEFNNSFQARYLIERLREDLKTQLKERNRP